MASRTKEIGLIGEQVLITEFVKHGIPVLVPIGDNLPYDMVIESDGTFFKIQVKTTEFIKDGKMIFETNITNPFKKTIRKYSRDEVDMFGLFCVENSYIGLMPISECTSKETVLRIKKPKNNQKAKVKMAEVYSFENMIKKLL